MSIVEISKDEYWRHFCEKVRPHPVGFTPSRLRKAKKLLWDDKDFWDDILLRHRGLNRTPEQMKVADTQNYEHCMGNMAGMIRQTMQEHGILK